MSNFNDFWFEFFFKIEVLFDTAGVREDIDPVKDEFLDWKFLKLMLGGR